MRLFNHTFASCLLFATLLLPVGASAGGLGSNGAPAESQWLSTAELAAIQQANAYMDYYDGYYGGYYDGYYDGYYGGYYDGWGADLAGMGDAGWALATAFGYQAGCGGTTLAGVYAVDPFCGY